MFLKIIVCCKQDKYIYIISNNVESKEMVLLFQASATNSFYLLNINIGLVTSKVIKSSFCIVYLIFFFIYYLDAILFNFCITNNNKCMYIKYFSTIFFSLLFSSLTIIVCKT